MTRILQGVLQFQKRIFGTKQELFEQLAKGQKPLALFITCSDSRIIPDLLAQTQPGELFVLRNAGNIVPPYTGAGTAESATIEYSIAQLGVRDVILCGHSRCGAMHGLLEPAALAKLPCVASWLEHSKAVLSQLRPDAPEECKLEDAIEKNVLLQLEHLKTYPAVQQALAARTLRLHGWVYHFEKGEVVVYDPLIGKFVPVASRVSDVWRKAIEQDATPRSEWQTRA